MRSYFIGHGSPMNAVSDNTYTTYLKSLTPEMGTPRCIIVFSAHWITRGTYITGSLNPKQIYDFTGFPDELYEVRYRPAGMPEIAEEIHQRIPEIHVDSTRGIDHAAWAVIKHIYPNENIPVLEMSLNHELSNEGHVAIGKKLAALHLNDVLFIGSGNVVHNLYELDFSVEAEPFTWASACNEWLIDRIASDNQIELIEAERYLPNYFKAAPTNDHFLPLFYLLGLRTKETHIRFNEIQNGSISMLSFSVE